MAVQKKPPLTKESLLVENGQLKNTILYFEERIAELEFAREDVGWVRLGEFSDNEFSFDFLRKMVARSRLFFIQNPLINRAVSLQSDYVWAQGVNIQATNDDVNLVIQAFMDDSLNKREFTSHKARLEKEQTLLLDGNVFFVLFTDKENTGFVKIRSILVEEITNIITNPDDANEIWYYKREWVSRTEDNAGTERHVAYYPDIDYNPTARPLTRNGSPVIWDAPILHVKSGSLAKSRYGIPETYSALDWASAHSNMLQNWATIIRAYAAFAFKFTTPGGKNSIVAARNKMATTVSSGNVTESNPPTTVGAMFARTKDGVDIEPIKTSGATTSAKDARELRIMVAAAMGLPDPMLSGEVDVGNLATAKTLDRPTELKFRSRQQLWTDVTRQILDYIIRSSILAPNGSLNKVVKPTIDNRGVLILNKNAKNEDLDLHCEVVFPPILEHSVTERIEAVLEAVTLNGKTFALNSVELQKLTMRLMLQALGLNDVDELVDGIFATLSDTNSQDNTNDSGNTSSNGSNSNDATSSTDTGAQIG